MRVLVTNDDGIRSTGLHALAVALIDAGHDVVVAAPASDHSGFGAAIGPLHLSGRVAFERVAIEALPGIEAVAVDGPPALAAMAGCLGGFGRRPDAVASGINAGANLGRAVLHSGTVGAALTAANFGVPAVAVSLAVGAGDPHWSTAADAAVAVVPWVAVQPGATVVNLNVPDVAAGAVRGVEPAPLDTGGVVQAVMEETAAGELELRMPSAAVPPRAGTDTALVADGFATVTLLSGVTSGGDAREASGVVRRAGIGGLSLAV